MLDAFALGARHGLDADHLAAISELAAGERGGWRGFGAGVKYALGHAAAVALLGLAAAEAGVEVADWVIGVTLLGLGAWASVRLLRGHTHEHAHVVDGTVVRHVHRHRHAIGVGVVHGLGGAPSAVLAGSRGGLALAAFTVGLLLTNGAVGAAAGVTTKLTAVAWVGIVGAVTYGMALVVGLA
jgi:hypothetical protein